MYSSLLNGTNFVAPSDLKLTIRGAFIIHVMYTLKDDKRKDLTFRTNMYQN